MNERVKAIVNLIIAGVLFVNAIAAAKGMSPIPINEDAVAETVSSIASGLSILWVWWKNQNLTAEAISAQDYLNGFKKEWDKDEKGDNNEHSK